MDFTLFGEKCFDVDSPTHNSAIVHGLVFKNKNTSPCALCPARPVTKFLQNGKVAVKWRKLRCGEQCTVEGATRDVPSSLSAQGRWVKTFTYGEERTILPQKNHLSMFTCYSTGEKVVQNLLPKPWSNRVSAKCFTFVCGTCSFERLSLVLDVARF